MTDIPPTEALNNDLDIENSVLLSVIDGAVKIDAPNAQAREAELSWPNDRVKVWISGELQETGNCRVPHDAQLRVEAVVTEAKVRYSVTVSRDRMEATMRVLPEPGTMRTLVEADPTPKLRLQVDEEILEPGEPTMAEASAELQRVGVVYGLDQDKVQEALDAPNTEFVVATGLDAIEGRDGYIEPLVDFEALRLVGVRAETPLLRRVRRRPGVPGRDVTGRELSIPTTQDVRIRPGQGVSVDEMGVMAVATVDGAPWMDSEGNVEVRHELVLEVVDTVSGDIDFNGSVRVQGDVGEARRVVARDELIVEGNVDRAHLESGGSMHIAGSIMSSVLRAGGERAVAATIADRILDLPAQLGVIAAQARQIRDLGATRGADVSHGLSIQLVIEKHHRGVLSGLTTMVNDLREAGPAHTGATERVARWLRELQTAAVGALTVDQYQQILEEVTTLADDVRRAIENPADLLVNYMQASEAEATGQVTLVGRGIFNSRIVAWGGLAAKHHEAVVRGGSVLSHGKVHVREVGSPAGAKTVVQLASGASLEADRAYAGTVVTGPGYTHRFEADRASIHVNFDTAGSMNVESLAA